MVDICKFCDVDLDEEEFFPHACEEMKLAAFRSLSASLEDLTTTMLNMRIEVDYLTVLIKESGELLFGVHE